MDVKKLFETYCINPEEHPNLKVTSNGNVYTTGVIDPADKGDIIYPVVVAEENEVEETTQTPKKTKK